jgi:hypothetical protein
MWKAIHINNSLLFLFSNFSLLLFFNSIVHQYDEICIPFFIGSSMHRYMNIYTFCLHCWLQWVGITTACTIQLWVRIPLMVRCTRYNIMWSSLSVQCGRSVISYLRLLIVPLVSSNFSLLLFLNSIYINMTKYAFHSLLEVLCIDIWIFTHNQKYYYNDKIKRTK